MNGPAHDEDVTKEQFEYQLSAIKRMNFVDSLEPEIRECVHDFGIEIVRAFLHHGVQKARSIRHIVRTILDQSSGSGPMNYIQKNMMDQRAATWLAGGGYLVVPKIPTQEMVAASINALDDARIAHTSVGKSRKHAIRLIHANVAGHASIAGTLS